jgi:predicted membrane protein
MANKTAFGIIIIGFGVIWLLDSFGIVPAPSLGDWLPILFIAAGVWKLLASQFKSITFPVILIAIGLVLGLLRLEIIDWEDFWLAIGPVILILIGINVLTGKKSDKGYKEAKVESKAKKDKEESEEKE